MKRRDFLVTSAGIAGAMVPIVGRSQATPCPPPKLTVGSSSVTTACAPSNAPAWFTAMADKTWTAVAGGTAYGAAYQNGTRVTDVLPAVFPGGSSSISIVEAWNGAAVDQVNKLMLMCNNGGHGDYHGNEGYALSLQQAVPAWKLMYLPTPVGNQGSDNAYPTNNLEENMPDGNPYSTHSYNRPVWGNGAYYLPGLDGTPNANQTSAAWKCNTAALVANKASWPIAYNAAVWSYLGLGLSSIGGGDIQWNSGHAIWDRINQYVWSIAYAGTNGAGQGVYSINTNTGALTAWAFGSENSCFAGTCAYKIRSSSDPGFWLIAAVPQGLISIADLTSPLSGFSTVTPTDPGGYYSALTANMGCVYHAASAAMLCWNDNGANIIKIAVPTSNMLAGAYTVSQVTPAVGNTVTPSSAYSNGSAGNFSKFNLVEDMGNGQGALVILNDISQPTYVYKLPAAGV
jgi:hypothetical protein